jgi:hypothetical protein
VWTGSFARVQESRFNHRVLEVAVVVAGVLVATYAGWVIRNVGGTTPDRGLSAVASATPSVAPVVAAPRRPPRLGPFRAAVGDAGSILVIGDSTGNDPGEWVDLWAQDLGRAREVTLRQWASGAEEFADPPLVYGSGRALGIWNLSYPGVRADYAGRLASVPVQPDAVILNVGHNRSANAIRRVIRTTTPAIEDRWGEVPEAYVLQNPSTADPDQSESAVTFLRTLATQDRVPVIDVHAAFLEAGPLGALLGDGTRPNAQGSRVWADAVGAALIGQP